MEGHHAQWEVDDAPRPPSWRRGPVVGAALVIALGLAALVAGVAPRATHAVLPVAASASPPPTPPDPASWSPPDRRTRLRLALAVPAEAVRVLDVDAAEIGAEVPIRPAVGEAVTLLARAGSATIVQAMGGATFAFDDDLHHWEVGSSWSFVPAAPDRVWLLEGEVMEPDATIEARLVDLDGDVLRPPVPRPEHRPVVGGRGERVLLTGTSGAQWWEPATGRTAAVPGRPLHVGPRTTVVCREGCRVVEVLDLDDAPIGALRTDRRIVAALASRDGSAVALLADSSGTTASTLLVGDLETGDVEAVAGGAAVVVRRLVAWSADGQVVCFATTDGRLGVLDRADGTVHAVDVDLTGVAEMIAIGGG